MSALARRRSLGITGVLFLVMSLVTVIGLPALAHTPNITANCSGLTASYTAYNTSGDNEVTVTVDGVVVDHEDDFGSSYSYSQSWDQTKNHTYSIVVLAWDDPNITKGWSGTWSGSITACKQPTTTTIQGTTTTAAPTTTTAAPTTTTAAPTTTTTAAPTTTTAAPTTTTTAAPTTTTAAPTTTTTAGGSTTTTTAGGSTTSGPTNLTASYTLSAGCDINDDYRISYSAVNATFQFSQPVVSGAVVSPPATIMWTVTPNGGASFANPTVTAGQIEVVACGDAEVLGIQVSAPDNAQIDATQDTLPFTGASTGSMALLAAAFAGAGLLLVLAARQTKEQSPARSWN